MKRKKDFPEVVALCGSTKFKEEYEKVNCALTLEGKVVISVGVFGHSNGLLLTKTQKKVLDEIHRRKIDLANSIIVVDVDGYIGKSTRNEIKYAQDRGKKVYYYSEYFE